MESIDRIYNEAKVPINFAASSVIRHNRPLFYTDASDGS